MPEAAKCIYLYKRPKLMVKSQKYLQSLHQPKKKQLT